MSSALAESFLDDLDDLDNGSEEENDTKVQTVDQDNESDSDSDDEEITMDNKLVQIVKAKVSSAIGNLRKSSPYKLHMLAVKSALDGKASSENLTEDDPEYQLVIDSNRITHEIDDEVLGTHRYVADLYSNKFPELESLIPNKVDYIRAVKSIGNEMDLTLVDLNDILPSATVMVVSVTGSATSGKPLLPAELSSCLGGCEEVLQLEEDKAVMLQFVESRMTRLAPNLSVLIGARIAAQLVGLAGGIVALSKIPSCNIQVLGRERRHLAGFSAITAMQHTGILYYCDLVQSCPPAMRRKALKVLSGKVAIVARIDSFHHNSAGEQGAQLRRELEEKFEKQQEPMKARTKKALPIPEEKKRSKRGGKRVRKMKERYAMTEFRQQQNRISFSLDAGEYGDSSMGLDSGMLGRKDTGKIRVPQMKASQLAKKQKKSISNISSGGGQISGLASSLSFTPVQGMELINPNAAAEKVKAANNKWFNAHSGFMSAAPLK